MRSFPVQKLFGSIFCVYATPMAADCRRYGLDAGLMAWDGVFSYTRGLWRQVAAATDWARGCCLGTRFFRIRGFYGGRLPPLRIGRGVVGSERGFFRIRGFYGGLEAAATAVEAAFVSVSGGVCAAKAFPRLTSDHTNTKRSRNPFRPSCAGRFCLACRRFFRRRRGLPYCPLSTKGSFSFCPAP